MNSRSVQRLLLHGARALGLFRLARLLTRSHVRILCYHGFSVGDEFSVLPDMFMREETFRGRMRILDRLGVRVTTLDQAVLQLQRDDVSDGPVVITLDDGWTSNLTIGRPVLTRHGFPATVYVTTEHLNHDTVVFNMVVAYLFRTTPHNTVTLSGVHPQLDGTYTVRPDPTAANRAIARIADFVLSPAERTDLIGKIAVAFGANIESILVAERFRLLTEEQMRELEGDGISIELHTHRHRLPRDDFHEMRSEIISNRDAIAAVTGSSPEHFCYPSGEYGPSHPEWLASLGIKSATTCDPGLNDCSTNPYLLRRFLDQDDISEVEFESFVCGFQHLVHKLVK
jgi:peptidoglycan/xylan/chitin deacetylase (PgdA/CDA1 family)